jgi:TatD DNase family protein
MIIDSHVHLDNYRDNDITRVIDEINRLGIFTLNVSMTPEGYLKSREMVGNSKFIVNCVGVHPWEAHKYSDKLESLDKYIEESPAIGEIGLDLYWIEDKSLFPKQRAVFEYFMCAAGRQKKVVNLHTKGAEEEVLQKIKEYNSLNPIVHWYSGPEKLIKNYIDAGAYFTVSVELMYSKKIQSILKKIPDDRLLLETDNPGGYQWLTKKVGYPSIIFDVAGEVGKIKNISKEKVIEQCMLNFRRVFSSSEYISDKIDAAVKF